MDNQYVYLAGPISGCTYSECVGWRKVAHDLMEPHGIVAISPMRGKAYLAELLKAGETHAGDHLIDGAYDTILSTAPAIMSRDYFDCHRASVILANLLDAPKVSIGTVMEMAWGYTHPKPIVVVARDGDFHDHPMLKEAAAFWTDDLHVAIGTVIRIIQPGVFE